MLFHGWGFNHQIWNDLVPHLQEEYTLYLVDLPGFGRSDLMEWHDFKRLLLLQLPEQFAVLGWSMGGLYAMRLALEEKDRVSHLIAIASSPYFIQELHWPGIDPLIFAGFAASLQSAPAKTLSEFIALQAGNYIFSMDSELPGLQAGLESLTNWDFRKALIDYDKPTCFVFGRLDSIVPFKTLFVMQCDYPQFIYYSLKAAAHMPFLSHQSDFISIIREFL